MTADRSVSPQYSAAMHRRSIPPQYSTAVLCRSVTPQYFAAVLCRSVTPQYLLRYSLHLMNADKGEYNNIIFVRIDLPEPSGL